MKHYGESTLPNSISGATDVLDFLVPFSSALITGLDIISDTSNGTGDVLFDILKNGVSVFSNPANRPKIVQGQTSVSLSNLTFAATKNDVLKVRAVTVPAGGIGGSLRLIITLDDQLGTAANISFRGQWQTGVNYFLNDVVLYGNKSFIAKATSNSVAPDSDVSKWAVFGGIGGTASRETKVYTTAALAVNAESVSTVALAESFTVISVDADRACRVRLYDTAAHQAADAARPIGTDPTGNHGLIMELVFTAAGSIYLTPAAIGSNNEAVVSSDIPVSVQNRSTGTSTVQLAIKYLATEA